MGIIILSMYAILAVLASIALADIIADINPEAVSCTLVANGTAWDLTDMESNYNKSGVFWSMCKYVDTLSAPKGYGNETEAFAYMTVNKIVSPLTSGVLPDADSHH